VRAVRRRWVLGAAAGLGAVATCASVHAQDARLPGTFEAWRRRFDERAGVPSPEALLEQGEALLAAGEAEAALEVLQRAANMAHTPQIECTIVRAQVQADAYRQALAFGAHAALSHRGFPSATALYAWLLHAGGQPVIATRLLDDALRKAPDDVALRLARDELGKPWPQPSGPLLSAPLRCAPYAHGDVLPTQALRCVATGVLAADGRSALVPRSALDGVEACWLRNGLGRTVRAHVSGHADGWTLLRLAKPLPVATAEAAPSTVFAGSPVATTEFMACEAGDAAWPVLRQGFAGRVPAQGPRALGIELPPGPRGGPVFDRAGRLAGVALAQAGVDTLVSVAALPPGVAPAAAGAAAAAREASLDAIYETALRLSLQVLVSRA
jgi:tetratricopeptide (TPR) repeat protein